MDDPTAKSAARLIGGLLVSALAIVGANYRGQSMDETTRKTITRLLGGLLVSALAYVGGNEGLKLVAYKDGGGVPTICYGATVGVQMGQRATPAECAARLISDLKIHEAGLRACLPRPDAVPERVYLAVLDFTYNVGVKAACGSTLVAKLRAGDWRGACNELPKWVYDNGQIVPGLVNRRAGERALCLSALR
ncbi:MAG: lysozyme [Pseudomonadota bacterium]